MAVLSRRRNLLNHLRTIRRCVCKADLARRRYREGVGCLRVMGLGLGRCVVSESFILLPAPKCTRSGASRDMAGNKGETSVLDDRSSERRRKPL